MDNFNENKIFDQADFSGTLFYEIEFLKCTFINCNFAYADINNSDFMDCIFDNCNFIVVKVKNVGFKNVQFIKSKITGVDFSVCNNFLFSFNFHDCIIDYCSFYGKKLKKTHFKTCSIKETDFSEADVSDCWFDNCDLLNSIFRQTKLMKTNFSTAVNYMIDPEQNNIKKAKFSSEGLPGLLAKYDIIIE